MIVICPTCRAPSNTSETRCWVCRRVFNGSEAVIGDLPRSRAQGQHNPLRLADVLPEDDGAGYFYEDLVPPRRAANGR